MSTNGTGTQGWTSSPSGRGSSDIIISCVATTFLCCWTSVYPNIAARSDSKLARFRDKLGLASLGILGPDFLIVLAVGQKSSARRSVRKFHAAGFLDWTTTHAFFADMGGFTLEAPGLQQPIPLDAEQVFYLVQCGYVAYPQVPKRDLDDRNKSDGLSRFLTIFQAAWFTVNVIARAIQHLTVTTIELTTLSFVIILFGTAWCWKDKPSDVTTTVCLKASVSIDEIVRSGGSRAAQPYYHTPLDFVSRYEDPMNLIWQYYNEIARKIWFSPISRRVKTVPWDRIPGDIFLAMDFDLALVCEVFILLFSSMFLLAWKSQFPSAFERDAWRAASIYMMTYGIVGSIIMGLWMFIFLPESKAAAEYELSLFEESLKDGSLGFLSRRRIPTRRVEEGTVEHPRPRQRTARRILDRIRGFLSRTHNISPDKDPHLGVPIGLLLPTTILCIFYCVFRLYILAEDIVALRSLPSDAYATTNWLLFLPHI